MISHFHGDHINGLINAGRQAGVPQCRNPGAGGRVDVLHGRRRDEPADHRAHEGRVRRTRTVFDALGRKVTHYERGKEVAPGITAVATPGHTPGHMSLRRRLGQRARSIVQADVTNLRRCSRAIPAGTPCSTRTRRWRRRPAARSTTCWSAEKMMVQGFHYPFPGWPMSRRAGNGYREVPVPWNPDAVIGDACIERQGRPSWAAFAS